MCADAYHASLWHTPPKFFAGRHAGHLLFRKVPHNARSSERLHEHQCAELSEEELSQEKVCS